MTVQGLLDPAPALVERIAGQRERGSAVFSPRAIAGLHKASGGVPRLVNILAHKAHALRRAQTYPSLCYVVKT